MSNVVEIGRSCSYLVTRAARHRRAGRYDEAMALLSSAKNQFGLDEAIELEMARVYEAIGCDEEAGRSYLRVVRMDQEHKGEALFHLSVSAMQRADVQRAVSYYQQYKTQSDAVIAPETAAMYERQLQKELKRPSSLSSRERAGILERRAVNRLQIGRTAAAIRSLRRAVLLHPNAQRHTMLACCYLLRSQLDEAIDCAETAHRMAPSQVQPLCVLADAMQARGDADKARKYLYLAALRAKTQDDLHAAAMECAKFGENSLTLRLTGRLLRLDPFHTHAMLMRACAQNNMGKLQEASRLFGRLCGLLPEDSVCESYYRMASEGRRADEPLDLGLEVTRTEGTQRAAQLISLLYQSPDEICADKALLRRVCRYCAWALRSAMVGSSATTVALILMGAIEAPQAQEVLLDALTDPKLPDSLKLSILQILYQKQGMKPYDVDFEGRLVRLAAGGVSDKPVRSEANSRIVQRACDALSSRYPDAPTVLLPIYLKYLELYGEPGKKRETACTAALECVYLRQKGIHDVRRTAMRCGIAPRLCEVYIRRMLRAMEACEAGRACKTTE